MLFSRNKKESDGVFKSIFAAYLILVLHVVLLAGIGMTTVFIKGISDYMVWVLLGGFLLIGSGCYVFFRFLKRETTSLRAMMDSPMLSDRSVEVSLLGGFASIKIGSPAVSGPQLGYDPADPQKQLENQAVKDGPGELENLKKVIGHPHIMPDEYGLLSRNVMAK